MLIKLAIFDNKKQEKIIIDCCKQNNTLYIPLFENKFGMLTGNHELSYGKEDKTYHQDFNVKTFVNIYRCVFNYYERKSKFGKRDKVPYSGEILDNVFFKNVVDYCNEKNIEIHFLRFTSDLESDFTSDNLEEINEALNQIEIIKILKLSIILKDVEIIFNKIGYVDIGSEMVFYETNKNDILKMIEVGFKD